MGFNSAFKGLNMSQKCFILHKFQNAHKVTAYLHLAAVLFRRIAFMPSSLKHTLAIFVLYLRQAQISKTQAFENTTVLALRIFVVADLLCKGKAIPLQTWTDPEVSRRLRLPDFKTIGT